MSEFRHIIEEKERLLSFFCTVEDYIMGNITVESSPSVMECENRERMERVLECVALLMEGASEETKHKIKEELA